MTLRLATVTGSVSLVTSRIGGDMDLTGATVTAGRRAVDLGREHLGAFFLRDGARVAGTLSLNSASSARSWTTPTAGPPRAICG